MPDTPQLTIRAARGDTHAFRTLVELHQHLVYSVARRFTGNDQDAEDIVQEVFVRVWKNISRYRPGQAKFSTWLYQITSNYCLDVLKSSRTRSQRRSVALDVAMHVAGSSTPERDLQAVEINELVLKIAAELSPKQRMVFVLRDLEGLSPGEACDILKMSAGTLKSNLFLARQRMAERLKATLRDDWK